MAHSHIVGFLMLCLIFLSQVARVATFSSDKLSYIAKPSESIGNNFDITFKMKTKQDEALLMYAGHSDQVIYSSLNLCRLKDYFWTLYW